MFRYLILAIIVCGFLGPWPYAAVAQTQQQRPKVGLVLGGGGAKGLAHVGVIKVLEDNHIPVDVVAGTSMGAIVGALYASGYSADEIDNIARELDWSDIFDDKTARSRATFRRKSDDFGFLTDYKITFRNGKILLPEGLIHGQNLFLELSKLLAGTRGVGSFDDLPIPFRLVATDLETGNAVVMRDGDLATAVFASMAIPGFIPPVERDGRRLLDGGLVNNVPVDLARELGADIVIVVNVGSDPKPASEIGNFIDVLRQTQVLLTQKNTQDQLATLGARDILIEPDMTGLGVSSFNQAQSLIGRGEAASKAQLQKLTSLRLNERAWLGHLMRRISQPQISPVIDRIEIENASKLSDDIIKVGISLKPGDVFEAAKINKDIERLYGGGIFDRITYNIEERGDEHVLKVYARAKDTSDGYFRFGIALDSNLESESSFTLGVSYTKPQINIWGAEWRSELRFGDKVELESEFYQPLGATQRFFIEPSVFYTRDIDTFFDDDDRRRGKLKLNAYGGKLQGGILLGRWAELRTGVAISEAKLDFSDKTLGIDNFSIKDSYALVSVTTDRLDSLSFPTQGGFLNVSYQKHDEIFGGQTQFESFALQGFKPYSFGRHTIGLGASVGGSTGRDANLLGTINLGGFLSLSGFSEDELSGNAAAMVFATYYYRLNRQAALFDAPLFVGGSLEAGNVYPDFADINFEDAIIAGSVFAGVKSPIGPVFVGLGTNDTGATSLYFTIGSFF